MSSVRVWPIDDREIREGYIIHDDAQRQRIKHIAETYHDIRADAALVTLKRHYIATLAMIDLKAVLDAYTAGRVT